jgi:alpha,alpha-trehalose phosphorylase
VLQRKPINLPQHVYPIDTWRIVEKQFYPRFLEQAETIFTMANGYLGMRGCCEEGTPVFENGTYINGFFETWPICYGEEAYGFAKEGQTIVNITDTKAIKLFVDDEPFLLPDADLIEFERVLDMRAGTLDRKVLWEMRSGKRVAIESRRLVSYEDRHLAAISYEVTVLNAEASVDISSEMNNDEGRRLRSGDPRLHHSFKRRVLVPHIHSCRNRRVVLGHKTEKSGLKLVCGIDHLVETDCPVSVRSECSEQEGKVVFSCQAKAGAAVRITKFMAYHTSAGLGFDELSDCVDRSLDRALAGGFEELLSGQRRHLDDFWHRSDVRIEGDAKEPQHRAGELQQALRFNLFHIFQAAFRVGDMGIPAKGLTGQAYDGNYFWDTEAYVLPFLIHTYPHLARNLLDFRYRMLDKARQRAREVSEQGALFPWRTIDGEEASAYYAAGTAQYHINGDIMYALQKYIEVTGDEDFLFEKGAEMLAETARMWYGLGFFSERREGKFCIHGVTGPDEYTTVVDNNLYTNLMAQNNLSYAVATLEKLKQRKEDLFVALAGKINLKYEEIDNWRRAADRIYLPYDEGLKIHPQDDTFLEKKVWDFAHTPADHYPLLLHYHPLVVYRQQVIKQADVALAMVLLGDRFSLEQKRRNFDYYDPLTTGDSSLSVCIQSILAQEVGYPDKAMEYARYAVLMDLGNVEGNVKDGCHIASLGGSWMLCVYGLAGMREYGGHLSFSPRLPKGLKSLHFPLTVRGRVLEVEIKAETATYRLREGEQLTFQHWDQEITLSEGESKSVRIDSQTHLLKEPS